VPSGALCAGLVADLCSTSPEPSASLARVSALANAAWACILYVDDPSLAHRLVAEMEAAPAELVASDPATAGLVWRARAFQARRAGDLTRLFECMEAAASSFELAGNARATCACRCNLSYAYVELGAHAEAERQLRRAIATSAAMGLSQPPIGVDHALGLVLLYVGRLDEATALGTRVAGLLEGRGEPLTEGATRMNLAMVHLAAGRLAEGEAEARRAAALLATFSAFRPMALAALANVLVARGEAHAALEVAREALAGVSAVQVQGPFVRLSYVEALAATGDRLGAEQAIRETYALLLEDAAKIGDPSWRERFLRDVPENARIVALEAGAHRAP
jgi:tetratricopeptide (TPR) repeat protein